MRYLQLMTIEYFQFSFPLFPYEPIHNPRKAPHFPFSTDDMEAG